METESELDVRCGTQEPGNQLACRRLYTQLIHSCKGAALDRVINAGPGEGLKAWKDMVERYEPRQRTRQAGLLQTLMAWPFAGDPLERLVACEREVARWEQLSGERLNDIGLVIKQVDEGDMKRHLVYTADPLNTWPVFRAEVINVRLALGTSGQGPAPMDVGDLGDEHYEDLGAVGKGSAKGKGGGPGKFLGKCW